MNSIYKIYCFSICHNICIREQIWPCRKEGQGQPRIIICTIFVVPEFLMMYTKLEGHHSAFWFWRRFLTFFLTTYGCGGRQKFQRPCDGSQSSRGEGCCLTFVQGHLDMYFQASAQKPLGPSKPNFIWSLCGLWCVLGRGWGIKFIQMTKMGDNNKESHKFLHWFISF